MINPLFKFEVGTSKHSLLMIKQKPRQQTNYLITIICYLTRAQHYFNSCN